MPPSTEPRAQLFDLYRVEGKAELIGGRIVRFPGAGCLPSRLAQKIMVSLDDYAEARGLGQTFTGGLIYAIPELASGRESFSTDVSYYVGPFPEDPMSWIEGPPTLAIEVRNQEDYGPAAEAEMDAKRADYFEAGTLVVWDVDTVAKLIRVYRSDDPAGVTIYVRGEIAEAEPAAPGWRIAVDSIFR